VAAVLDHLAGEGAGAFFLRYTDASFESAAEYRARFMVAALRASRGPWG
jgi:hypothetical protein